MKETITVTDYREKVKYEGISAYLRQPQDFFLDFFLLLFLSFSSAFFPLLHILYQRAISISPLPYHSGLAQGFLLLQYKEFLPTTVVYSWPVFL